MILKYLIVVGTILIYVVIVLHKNFVKMKNVNWLWLLIGMMVLTSCGPDIPKESSLSKELKGVHKLRTFNVRTKKTESWSASYFLIMGSASGGTSEETKVKFSWLNNHNQYVISELPINKIRVEINDTMKTPQVKFRWNGGGVYGMDFAFSNQIQYMVVICKEEDYPINININEL